MRESITISRELAEELFALAPGGSASNLLKVADFDGDKGRWVQHCLLVFMDIATGKYYAIDYQLGLTEYQDNDFPWDNPWFPWGTKRPAIQAQRVFPHEETVVTWKYAEE